MENKLKLKIGQPVYIGYKDKFGRLCLSSTTAYYYLGHGVVGSFYDHLHRIAPSFNLYKTEFKYIIPCSENLSNINSRLNEFLITNIEDANDIDNCKIEFYKTIKGEIESYY